MIALPIITTIFVSLFILLLFIVIADSVKDERDIRVRVVMFCICAWIIVTNWILYFI